MMTKKLAYGVYGGLAGGLVFGFMMAMMGMLPMIGQMVGAPSAAAGFAVHMVNSAVIGLAFAMILHWIGARGGLATGLAYGLLWWGLGPLTLMPLFMGMGFGVNWTATAVTQAIPSLVGHLVFGAILGWTYRSFARHASGNMTARKWAKAA